GAGDFLDVLIGFLGALGGVEHHARRLPQTLLDLAAHARHGPADDLRVRALADLPGGDPRARGAAALQIDVVDLIEARLQRRRHDDEAGWDAPVIVAVGIAHRVEHFDDRDVLHL